MRRGKWRFKKKIEGCASKKNLSISDPFKIKKRVRKVSNCAGNIQIAQSKFSSKNKIKKTKGTIYNFKHIGDISTEIAIIFCVLPYLLEMLLQLSFNFCIDK